MSERLATKLWVSALIRRCFASGGAAVVRARGDPHAGSVLLLLRNPGNRLTAYTAAWRGDSRRWLPQGPGEGLDDAACDAYIGRQRGYDSDLWVVEIEQTDLSTVLDEQYVAPHGLTSTI